MKKAILAVLVAGASTFAVATDTVTYYAQGTVSYNKSRVDSVVSGDIKDSTPSYKVAVGKDFGDMRYAVDYIYHDKIENKTKTTEVTGHSLGVAAYYDFETKNSKLTPYVGARVSVNHLEMDMKRADNTVRTKKKDKIGAGVVAGVQYHISPSLAVDVGAEYNHMGKVDNASVKQYGATVGARVNF